MLYGLLDALRVWAKPSMVVIVATDIRDRLFLLNEVRKALPNALPVLLEMDYLTAHPDYRKISRGAIVVANGETKLCMETQGHCLTRCRKDANEAKPRVPPDKLLRLSFPADYAANMFRAALASIDGPDGRCPTSSEPPKAELSVATLAGFQTLSSRGGSQLLAADGRLMLERPVAVGLIVAGLLLVAVAVWLRVHGRAHLVVLSPLRHLNPFPGVREPDFWPCGCEPKDAADEQPSPARLNRWLSTLLGALSLSVVALAGTRLLKVLSGPRDRSWDLVQGRDEITLLALFFLYLCLAVLSGWRVYLWRRRCLGHLEALEGGAGTPWSASQGRHLGGVVLGLAIIGILMLFLLLRSQGVPTAVDPAWPAMLVDWALLVLAMVFIVALWSESNRFAWLAQMLTPIADLSGDPSAPDPKPQASVPGDRGWANPLQLNSLPQSPFSLCFRERDLAALLAYSDRTWRMQTRSLLTGSLAYRVRIASGIQGLAIARGGGAALRRRGDPQRCVVRDSGAHDNLVRHGCLSAGLRAGHDDSVGSSDLRGLRLGHL